MSYLTFEERKIIAEMWENYDPVTKIAKTLGRSVDTIYRELARGRVEGLLDKNFRNAYNPTLGETNLRGKKSRNKDGKVVYEKKDRRKYDPIKGEIVKHENFSRRGIAKKKIKENE